MTKRAQMIPINRQINILQTDEIQPRFAWNAEASIAFGLFHCSLTRHVKHNTIER